MPDSIPTLTPELVRAKAEVEGWPWHLVVPQVAWPQPGTTEKRDLLLAEDVRSGAGLLYGLHHDGDFELLDQDAAGAKALLARLTGQAHRPEGGATATHSPITDLAAVAAALRERQAAPSLSVDALRHALQENVRGQDQALRELAQRVVLHVARSRPRRPLSVFALGPTGVGKTLTAETLAAALGRMVAGTDEGGWGYLRLDMSEYGEAHRVSQLLGAPPGYTGYGEGAELLDRLEERPRTVVLFDEIEKAHPTILRALMNALDAGRLSRTGRGQVDCRQAIFFFTSNAGQAEVTAALASAAGDADMVESQCRRALIKAGITPELVGRMGCFLVFTPLGPMAEAEVAALTIVRVAREYEIELTHIAPELVAELLATTKATGLGARPLTYRVDQLFGSAFLAATQLGWSGAWRLVTGPPPLCLPQTNSQPQGGQGA